MTMKVQNKICHFRCLLALPLTRDYKKFSFILGNRMLDELKIKRLIRDIKEGNNLLPVCPIIVDPQLQIIDGQHRYYAAQKTKQVLYYIIHEPTTIQKIASMNSRQKGWKNLDYLDCYVHTGNQNYIIFKQFIDEHKLSVSGAGQLLGGSRFALESFKEGKFEVADIEIATDIAFKLKIFAGDANNRQTNFIRAIIKLYKAGKIDWEVMEDQWHASGAKLNLCNSDKNYIIELEAIYNFRKQKRSYII